MKISNIPWCVLSTAFASTIVQSGASEVYYVQKNDYFTKIVFNHSRKSHLLGYTQMLALTLKVNEKSHLSEFSHLNVGQEIVLPSFEQQKEYLVSYQQKYPAYWDPSKWRINSPHKYTVQPGDSFNEIALRNFPNLPFKGDFSSIELLRLKNSSVFDINKIFVGQELALPTQQEIAEFQNKAELKRLPSQSDEEMKSQKQRFREFSRLNSMLLKSNDRVDSMTCLKNLLDYSRECKWQYHEKFYLKLISLFLNPKNEEKFLNELSSHIETHHSELISS